MRIEGSGTNLNRYQNNLSQNINKDGNSQIDSEQAGISSGRGRRVGRQERIQGAQRSTEMPNEETYSQDSELSNVLGQDEYIPNQQTERQEGMQGRFRNPNSVREGMGQDNQMGRPPMGRGRGHGGMNMPPMGPPPMGIGQNQGQMPNAEEFFTQVDQDGNGSITKEELQTFMSAQQASMMAEATASDSSETASSTSSASSDPAEIKNNVLANLVAMTESSDYEAMSDTEKQQIASAIEAVNALDTSDAQFMEKLQAMFGVSEADTSSTVSETSESTETEETTETLQPAQIKEQILANLVAMTQSSDYESMSDTEKQQISDAYEAVTALDANDAQFMETIQAMFGVSSSD